MLWLAALLALSGADAPGLRLAVDGSCPARADVMAAVLRSLARAKTSWPEGRRLDLRLLENHSGLRLELSGADGQVLLARSFHDQASDCAARAETVGLVVARYLESLGWVGEPQQVRAKATAPQARPSDAFFGLDLGLVVSGGVADPSGDTAVDFGPQVGARAGSGALGGALRVGWLAGDSFRSASTAGEARVDRIPITLAGFFGTRLGRWTLAAGPRLVLEAVRSAGATSGLRTDTTLAVRAGGEGELVVSLPGPWVLGLGAGLDIAVRRVEIQVRDPDTSEPVALAAQDLVVPFFQAFVGARWNLGR